MHYVSSGWVDPLDPEEGHVEEILKLASHRYNFACSSYRLPLVTINSKGGFMGDDDNIIFNIIKACRKTGMMSEEWEGMSLPLLPADAAGKFVVHHLMRGNGNHSRLPSPSRAVCLRNPVSITTYMPMTCILDWVDDMADKPVVRGLDSRRVMMAFAQALSGSKAQDLLAVMSKDGDEVKAKIMASGSGLSMGEIMYAGLHRPNGKRVVSDIKRYINDHPSLVAINENAEHHERQGGVEEAKDEVNERAVAVQ